jgi:2-polyprenyl-3-methyl-5-hydroxy-6-metoxy-1,4-benzoquinol methylase
MRKRPTERRFFAAAFDRAASENAAAENMDPNQQTFETFHVPDPIRIRKSIRLIKQAFPDLSGLRILECGLAAGGVADLLSKEGAHCFGVDIHPRQLDGVITVQADLNEGLPEFEQPFDVIFAGEVVEHLLDDLKFVAACSEALRPRGILVLTTPNLVFGVNRLRMMFGKMPLFAFAPYHYRIYNADTLESVLHRAGLKVVQLTSSHVLFSTRRNRVGRIFEILGDYFPTFGAHLIVAARKTG